jgi:hypothetical protein
MGRLATVQKPSASGSDPARSAKAASMKQAIPIRAEQESEVARMSAFDDPEPAAISMFTPLPQAAKVARMFVDGAADLPRPESVAQAAVPEPVIIDLTTEPTPAPASVAPAAPQPVSFAKAEASINNLGENDLRNVLLEISKSQPEARTIIQAFCKRAVGSKERPFDFNSLLEQCQEAVRTVGGAAWNQAAYDRDAMDDQCWLWGEAAEPIVAAIRQIAELCGRSTTSTETQMEAIETLLDIVDVVNETSGWDEGHFANYDDGESDFERQACSTIRDIIDTFDTEVRKSLLRTPEFRALMERFGGIDDLASVVDEIEGEMGGIEESGREESSD